MESGWICGIMFPACKLQITHKYRTRIVDLKSRTFATRLYIICYQPFLWNGLHELVLPLACITTVHAVSSQPYIRGPTHVACVCLHYCTTQHYDHVAAAWIKYFMCRMNKSNNTETLKENYFIVCEQVCCKEQLSSVFNKVPWLFSKFALQSISRRQWDHVS
jgi:hypothetical protein